MLFVLGVDLGEISSTYGLVNAADEQLIDGDYIPIVKNNKQCHEVVCTALKKSLDAMQILSTTKTNKYGNENERHYIIIVIEFQPRVNNKTIILFGEFFMYFVMEKEKNFITNNYIEKIIGYHAGNKLLYYKKEEGDPEIKTDYASKHYANKKIAIQQFSIILKRQGTPELIERFNKLKKRDDLADAFLMALAYIRFEIKKEEKPSRIVLKLKSSKPVKRKTTKTTTKITPTTKKPTTKKPTTKKTTNASQSQSQSQLNSEADTLEKEDSNEKKKESKHFTQYSNLKVGDPIPNKEGYIMGRNKLPVKITGSIGKQILKELSENK
jgi:hypothetical protein